MRRVRFTSRAATQLDDLVRDGTKRFGPEAAERYRALVFGAASALAEEPATSLARPIAGTDDLAAFHLRHARGRMPRGNRVGRPRHLLVFRASDAVLEVVALFHERMLLPRAASGLRDDDDA